jgi:hypothetical protein
MPPQKTQGLEGKIRALEEMAAEMRAARPGSESELAQELAEQRKKLRTTIRAAAIGDLRQEAFGLVLVSAGTLIAAVPGLFCGPSPLVF